jgi:glycosidase
LFKDHPDWFLKDAAGLPRPAISEWSDIIELDTANGEVQEYLIDVLVEWARFGVDGFRCDVASAIAIEFWAAARSRVAAVNPETIWLAESCPPAFIIERRNQGSRAWADGELYQAFDITYDYDIWQLWRAVVKGRLPVARYLEMLQFQDALYPVNAVKLRAAENHDQPRIAAFAKTPEQARAWTALQAFNKGAFLIYAGQEAEAVETPSLFDIDKIPFNRNPLQPFLTILAKLKKHTAQRRGTLVLLAAEPVVQAVWLHGQDSLFGIFNVEGYAGIAQTQLPDGTYKNLLDDCKVKVKGKTLPVPQSAMIVACKFAGKPEPYRSELLKWMDE